VKKILLADDDDGIVDATRMMLELENYEVIPTLQGQRILELAQKEQPDLIVMDIWMSGIDGRDICRMLKNTLQVQTIPVLMISASRETRQSALDAGATDFIEKPFDIDSLLEKVGSLLSK
jgi:two-component system alkaline phosphatase synthesis response regulator PhoP